MAGGCNEVYYGGPSVDWCIHRMGGSDINCTPSPDAVLDFVVLKSARMTEIPASELGGAAGLYIPPVSFGKTSTLGSLNDVDYGGCMVTAEHVDDGMHTVIHRTLIV